MKELNGLKLRIKLCECFHLALVTPCFALPIARFMGGGDRTVWLLIALGTIIPVQMIRFICDHVEKKPLKILLSFAVVGLAAGLTAWNGYWLCYIFTGVPMLICGLLLPRSKGKLIFTIPTLFTLLPIILLYVLGKIVPEPLICSIAVIQTAFTVLNYLLYVDQTRLLSDISMALRTKTEVSVTSMIRQNFRTVAAYLAVGLLIIAAIPILMAPRPEKPMEYGEPPAGTEVSSTPAPRPTYDTEEKLSEDGAPLPDLDSVYVTGTLVFVLMMGFTALAGGVYLIVMLLGGLKRRQDDPKEERDGITIERQKSEREERKKERITGYEKRIRRGYEKLIKQRSPENAKLESMTPTELERTAGISGAGAEDIHRIYCLTRYSGEPATKESFAAFRGAVRSLPAQDGKESPDQRE